MNHCNVFILLLLSTHSYCQQKTKIPPRIELDTSFFDKTVYAKFFEQDFSSYKLNRYNSAILYKVAFFNSTVKLISSQYIIRPKFEYINGKISQKIKFYISDSLVFILSGNRKIKNGYILNFHTTREGTCVNLKFDEYKNYKADGVSIYFNNCEEVFEKKFYKAELPNGDFTAYYNNGIMKESGDSVSITKIYFEKVPVYNNKGNIIRYERKKFCDTKKKGYWRKYDEMGKLINEEFHR